MEHEDEPTLAAVNAWFAQRGFGIAPSATDHHDPVAASRRATPEARTWHAWVDLTRDGRVVQRGYGGGSTIAKAAERARKRWLEEQGD